MNGGLYALTPYSSSGGISSSMNRTSATRSSVVSSPRSTSLTKCVSTCICTCLASAFPFTYANETLPSPTHHLQSPPYNTAQNIAKPQLILRPPIIRQLHKIRQRVLIKRQIERLPLRRPAPHRRRDIHKHLEAHSTNHLRRLAEIAAGPAVGFGEEVLDQAEADVVAHAVELGVDGRVVGFVGRVGEGEVAAELGDEGAVGEGQDFDVDFFGAGSGGG